MADVDHWMDAYARPQQLTPIGRRRRLNLHVTGRSARAGEPTVILAAGFLGVTIDWALVQMKIARMAQVVSFDNAGLGFSDPGPGARTSTAIVADLRAALRAANIAPPYVLVGHSAGSLRMRLFAAQQPGEIRGLVMVDPVTGDWQERLFGGACPVMDDERRLLRRLLRLANSGRLTGDQAEFRARVQLPRAELSPAMNAALIKMWQSPSYLRTAISESRFLRAHGEDELAVDRPFSDVPLAVLSAAHIGRSPMIGGDPTKIAGWFAMHDQIASLSARGSRQIVDAGHNIPIENPAAVVEAVRSVLAY
jgi:pimeloyl-ACP methyl ester carboxylesterase